MTYIHMSLCSVRTAWLPGALPVPEVFENQNVQLPEKESILLGAQEVRCRRLLRLRFWHSATWTLSLQKEYTALPKKWGNTISFKGTPWATSPMTEGIWENYVTVMTVRINTNWGLPFTHFVFGICCQISSSWETCLVLIVSPTFYNKPFSLE